MKIAASQYEKFCEGYTLKSAEKYTVGINIAIGVVEKKLTHPGSDILDQINSFDKAEVAEANIGQINMVTVSSFCGPGGQVWGYDIFKQEKQKEFSVGEDEIPVFSGEPLLRATKQLLGTVDDPVFPILPGSHVLCATKNIKMDGPTAIYAAIALGIPKDRNSACLMMEDVGQLSLEKHNGEVKKEIKQKLAESIIAVGANQKVQYEEIFVAMRSGEVPKNSMGCALVASPYLALPIPVAERLNKNQELTEEELLNLR